MNIAVEAKKRTLGRKSVVKQGRKDGKIPAVIYRKGEDSIPVYLDESVFKTDYQKTVGEISYFLINLDGKEYKTVIKEMQIHPVSRNFVHIDFQELIPDEEITLTIPIKFSGEPKGLKEGGKLDILVRKIKITAKPEDIPQEVKIDLVPLGIGQSFYFSDLKLDKIKSRIPDNTVLAQVKG